MSTRHGIPRTLTSAFALITALSVVLAPATRARAAEVQKAMKFTSKSAEGGSLEYLLYLPPGYSAGDKKWPLVVFLHGSGESGTNLAKVKVHGPPKVVEEKPDFPFILVSPQNSGRGWRAPLLNEMLDQVLADYRVDQDRVYLTGLSMGGFGTWAWAASHPERFAAIAPICGGGNTNDAPKLAKLPIWVFHGAQDRTVPPARSQAMVEAIKAAGGAPKFTLYPDAGHDSWTATYNNPEFYAWLLDQKRRRD